MTATPHEIEAMRVLPLFGAAIMFSGVFEALSFVKEQPETGSSSKLPPIRIEVQMRYKDGTRLEGRFPEKRHAIEFLKRRESGMSSSSHNQLAPPLLSPHPFGDSGFIRAGGVGIDGLVADISKAAFIAPVLRVAQNEVLR